MFGVLSKEQILEYCKNKVTKKIGDNKRKNMTDFAYDLLKEIEEIKEIERDYDSYYCCTSYGTSNARYSNNFYPFYEKVDIFKEDDSIYKLHLKYLPFIPYLSLDLLPERIKLKKDTRFEVVEFGCYPQTRCRISDYVYRTVEGEKLVFVYNADFTKYGYSPRGKISVRKQNYEGKTEDYIYLNDEYYKIEPISWIVDNEKNIMFPNSPVLFANIPYLAGSIDNQKNYSFIKEDSTIYQFIKNYFIPNIFQKENIDIKSLFEVDIKKYINNKGDTLLNEAKEKYNKELKKYINGAKKEELEELLKDKKFSLEKLLSERLDSYKDELVKKISDYKDEQLNKYEEEINKVEAELNSKLEEFVNETKDKEETFNYVKKQFDEIAKEEFDKKMLPIIDKHIKNLEKIKKDLTLSVSKLVSTSYTEFEDQVNTIMNSINSKEKEVKEILKKFKDEFIKLEEEKNKLKDEIKQDLNEIKEYKESISKELEEEVIKRVVEKNPVKEVNVTIDSVKKKGIKGLFHKDFEAILQLISLNTMPVFLVGPAGCGKNVIIKQCSKVLDKDFYYQNDNTEEHKLLGFVDANGVYHKTPFYEAFKKGGLLMLDEMDNSDASVLLKINSAIGAGNDFYMTFPNGEYVQANKNFQAVAAANTFGRGANNKYVGRNQLDMASLDRFFTYEIDYDRDLEKSLVVNKEILNLFWEVRDIVASNDIMQVVSTRAILNMDKIISSNIIGKGTFTIGHAFSGTLIKGIDEDDLRIIVSRVKGNDYYSEAFIEYGKKLLREMEEKRKEMENKSKQTQDEEYTYQKRYGGF